MLRQLPLTGTVRFETTAGTAIECSALSEEGETRPDGATGALTPLWELQGCQSEGQECHTTTAALVGEINDVFQWLEEPAEPFTPKPGWTGKLGWITRSPARVGIEYTADGHERLFDPISCRGPLGVIWVGGEGRRRTSLIATLTPINEMTSEIEESYAETQPGSPSPAKLEHRRAAVAPVFVDGRWEQLAITATFQYRVEPGEPALEIRAIG
ncbi:MAG: hypothetical protein ACLQBB_06210 [Solirubrobacteraceae bacterium]